MVRENEIRLIAYTIWEEEGCLEGRDCEHWFKAEIIWEQQQKPKEVAKITWTESKQAAKQPAQGIAIKQPVQGISVKKKSFRT